MHFCKTKLIIYYSFLIIFCFAISSTAVGQSRAISIAGSCTGSGAGSAATITCGPFGDNRILNPDMAIDQQHAGGLATIASNAPFADRWTGHSQPLGTFTAQQSSNAPSGISNSLTLTSAAATTASSTNSAYIRQAMEGMTNADLQWGTATAQPVIISFAVESSLTGTFCFSVGNVATGFTRSYVSCYSIPTANTWTNITKSVPGDTTGTWNVGTGVVGIVLHFDLGSGSNFQTSTLNAWQAGHFDTTSTATALIGTNATTFNITNVRFYPGTISVPYIKRPFMTELYLVQRYYHCSFPYGTAPANNAGYTGAIATQAIVASSYPPEVSVFLDPPMMATPGVIYYNPSAGTASQWHDITANTDIGVGSASSAWSSSYLTFGPNANPSPSDIIYGHYCATSPL